MPDSRRIWPSEIARSEEAWPTNRTAREETMPKFHSIVFAAILSTFVTPTAWAQRCSDLTGKYDCPGCEARRVANNGYILSNGAGQTTAVPIQDNDSGWKVNPGPRWGAGTFDTKDNCQTLDFGRGGLWHKVDLPTKYIICYGDQQQQCNLNNQRWNKYVDAHHHYPADKAAICQSICGQKIGEGCAIDDALPGSMFFELRCYAGPPKKTRIICHGQTLSECQKHPYNFFEHCGDDNGVGAFDRNQSCKEQCGVEYANGCEVGPAPGGSANWGGFCGYTWATIECHHGP
jgi:hypothetical protein